MYTLTIVIHLIVSVVLIIAVLFQVGKGASIGSTFGGTSSQTLFGSAGPATLLGKITVACAAIFMLTSLYLTYMSGRAKLSSVMSDAPAVTAPATPEGSLTQAPQSGPQPAEGK
jgi:preprotein translocase subunit SecG